MSIYYEDEFVTLHHGDAREVTEWLDADVLVTDPPYGRAWAQGGGLTNADGQGRSASIANDGIANDEDTIVRDEVLALWGDRPGIIFGDPLIPQPAGARQALVYAKPLDAGIRGARAGYRRDVEMIYLTGPHSTGIGGTTSILTTNSLVAGPRGLATRYHHPHAKPVDVLTELIARTTGTVADTFAGGGSTLDAARALGRPAIGVELDERYCETIARRLSQGDLLGGIA